MNYPRFNSGSSPAVSDELVTRWAPKIILLGIVLVVVSTLYPFKLSFGSTSLIQEVLTSFRKGTSRVDILANIILFMPLGFGFASLFAKRKHSIFLKLIVVLLLCAGLSFSVEILQVFLSGRKPTPFDVVSNTLGGGVGYGIFLFAGVAIYGFVGAIAQQIQRWIARFSLKQLIAVLAGYAVLASLLVVFWQSSSLGTWSVDLPLAIGKDKSSGMAWKGSVSDLAISDRALSKSEAQQYFEQPKSFWQNDPSLLAAYPLTGPEGRRDRTNRSPRLSWQGTPPAAAVNTGTVSNNNWLATSEPATLISDRIRKTSQFTLSIVIASADTNDTSAEALHRIIAIANKFGYGNFTLAHSQSDLYIWLQTSRRGRDHRIYQQIIPGVFPNANPQRFVITYSGFVLRVYVNSAEQALISDLTPNRYLIILYGLILAPLAFLIGLIADRLRRPLPVYLVLLGGGTVLPSLMLELFFATQGDREIRVANLLLGMLIVGGVLLAVRGSSRHKMRHRASAGMR